MYMYALLFSNEYTTSTGVAIYLVNTLTLYQNTVWVVWRGCNVGSQLDIGYLIQIIISVDPILYVLERGVS